MSLLLTSTGVNSSRNGVKSRHPRKVEWSSQWLGDADNIRCRTDERLA